MNAFRQREYAIQDAYLNALEGVSTGHQRSRLMLLPQHRSANFNPDFADEIERFFAWDGENRAEGIDWHTRSNHGASSQVCCVNFLFPFVHRPNLVERWIEHVTGAHRVRALPIDRRCGQDCYLTFEWFPPEDYLTESDTRGRRTRGANSTSVDAAVLFEHDGLRHLLLIEWKYTEAYPAKRAKGADTGDGTRRKRYGEIWRRPHGPIKADAQVTLDDFFLEPWYQLLRQQMLAYQCEADPLSPYDRASVLHISPSGNVELKRAKGRLAEVCDTGDVFAGFISLLDGRLQDRFKTIDTEAAFAPLKTWDEAKWHTWLAARYPSLLP